MRKQHLYKAWSHVSSLEVEYYTIHMPFNNIKFSATVPGPVEGLSITTSSYNLNLTWQPPVYPNGVLTGYQVTVTNLINITEAFSYPVGPNSQELIIDSGIRKLIIIHNYASLTFR